MNALEFYTLLSRNFNFFLIFLLLSLFLYFILFRKYIYSIFDPLIMNIIFSAVGTCVVTFLYATKMINTLYFYSYFTTQTAYIVGFLCLKPIKFKALTRSNPHCISMSIRLENTLTIIYVLSSLIYINSQLSVYFYSGIPLFMTSRLDTFVGSGGFGVIGRVIFAISKVSIYLLFYRLFYKQGRHIFAKIYDIIFLLLILIFSFLSGSKSTFLGIIFIFFYLNIYILKIGSDLDIVKQRKTRRIQFILFVCSFIATLLVIWIQASGNQNTGLETSPISKLAIRIVSSGDTFFYSYPNNVLEEIPDDKPVLALFGEILSALRIISYEDIPMSLGRQLHIYHYSSIYTVGPQAQHNVFGLNYFGFIGAIVFSYCIGCLMSFIRNKAYFILPKNQFGGMVYAILCTFSLYLNMDPVLGLSYFFNCILVLPLIIFISYIIGFSGNKSKIVNGNLSYHLP